MTILRLLASVAAMATGVFLIGYALKWIARGLSQLAVGTTLMTIAAFSFLIGLGTLLEELEDNKDVAKFRKTAERRLERVQRRTGRLWG